MDLSQLKPSTKSVTLRMSESMVEVEDDISKKKINEEYRISTV